MVKKPTITLVCLIVLLVVSVTPVSAFVSVESTIGDNIYIIYNFENLDPAVYNETMRNNQFNSSTIPQIIMKNLEKQNLTRISFGFPTQSNYDANKTIRVSFYLGGSDIISFTINRTSMRRTYQVKTEWRKFQVNLTTSFSIDFAQYFGEPVANWQKTNHTDPGGSTHPAFYYETAGTGFLDTLSFYFILPATATNIQVEGDTTTYEVSPYFEDVFLNSPFLILAVFIIIIAIVLVYRRVK